MWWKRLTQSLNRRIARPSPAALRSRPNLDPLEDRTLLTSITFFLDNTQSYLTVSGNLAGINMQPQDSQGTSLTTTYAGDLKADVDFTNGLVTFNNTGDGAIADISGNWQPKRHGESGTGPANYGATINFLGTGYAAVRNFVAGEDSNPLSLTQDDPVTWEFPSAQHFTIKYGVADYTHPLTGNGQFKLANHDANNKATAPGLLIDVNGNGSVYELYAPTDVTITGDISGLPYTLNLKGLIVGYGSPDSSPSGSGSAKGLHAVFDPDQVFGAHSPGHALSSGSPATLDTAHAMEMPQIALTQSPSPTSSSNLEASMAPAVHHAQGGDVNALDIGSQSLGPNLSVPI